jgi:aminopeptidase N
MFGKAWITLHPHFYPTDSLNLDAKKMDIKEVSVISDGMHVPLKYIYDSLNLHITLDRTYRGGESYTVFIDYIAEQKNIKTKGLFFINPLGKEKNKPTQIWTQGETETNSAWVPTIDRPNQKTTDEISITVPGKYQTLSNGLLVKQRNHKDGSRTDTWKMDLPHAPYLMMMAIGEYSIIRDSYKGKEVSYYVEEKYAPVARKIFGLTPEMIGYYSRITGVDYPWQKYSQVTGWEYGGAMENTTATLHSAYAQQNERQLADENTWEETIAHELFHQWFGDYVTTESWSNLTINESFATWAGCMWEEFKHGRDAGDEYNFNNMQGYLRGGNEKKDLVRFYFKDSFDMFDAVSYSKGGCILNMLRNNIGDNAFFKSLNLFLTTNKFRAVEAQELRLAFEEVTGQDLNWFWNEWFYGSGHPKLDISYDYDQASGTARVFVRQTQPDKVFKLPVAIDLYQGGSKKRYNTWLENQSDTFTFHTDSRPDLVNFDGDKILLCEKTDHKSLDNYIFQYKNAGLYLDRREAIEFAASKQADEGKALGLIKDALKDRYHGLRIEAIRSLNLRNDSVKNSVENILAGLAKDDPTSLVRAEAVRALGTYKNSAYKDFFLKEIEDSSYSVAGNALAALGSLDSTAALDNARRLSSTDPRGELLNAINNTLFRYAGENDFDSLAFRFDSLTGSDNNKFMLIQPFSNYLKRIKDPDNFRKGIDMLVGVRDVVLKENPQIRPYFNGIILNSIARARKSMGLTEQADYVMSKIVSGQPMQEAPILSAEILQRYAGEYDYEGTPVKVVLKENKTLSLIFAGQTELELVPQSQTKFGVKFMEGYTVEFMTDNDNVSSLTLSFNGRETKATKKK